MWLKQFAWNYNSAGQVQRRTRTSRLIDTKEWTEEDEPHYYSVDEILCKQGIMTFKKMNILRCN